MSLKVMHWAWSLSLSPAPKIVLLALADEANDDGFCFPSVPYLANKCSLDQRTVQRVLRKLAHAQYMSIEHRFRRDRARTSNGYRLTVSSPPANCHRLPRRLRHRPGDNGTRGAVATKSPGWW
jgi:hypothetical protein